MNRHNWLYRTLVAVGALFVVAFLVVGHQMHERAVHPTSDTPGTPAPEHHYFNALPINVDAPELNKAFDGNEISAVRLFGNRQLEFTGVVRRVSVVAGQPMVYTEGDVLLTFDADEDQDQLDWIGSLRPGQRLVYVPCTLGNHVLVVALDCGVPTPQSQPKDLSDPVTIDDPAAGAEPASDPGPTTHGGDQ